MAAVKTLYRVFSCDVIAAILEGKNNTFPLPWEIRSIFMQNCFLVSALQHGRRENPLYSNRFTFSPILVSLICEYPVFFVVVVVVVLLFFCLLELIRKRLTMSKWPKWEALLSRQPLRLRGYSRSVMTVPWCRLSQTLHAFLCLVFFLCRLEQSEIQVDETVFILSHYVASQ